MKKKLGNYAFIDSQNLNLSIQSLGWKLDFNKFRAFLREKYNVVVAYLFVGYLPENQEMYDFLSQCGFVLIFKPTVKYIDGTVKGNCDAEMVLQAMIDYTQYAKAVIVTGDGDLHCLVLHLRENQKLEKVIVPNERKYSPLLKNGAGSKIIFMNDLRGKLAYRDKKYRRHRK